MKKGFTLAEVLITLGIIGVVAALTAPALIQNTGTAKVGPTLAKAVTTLELANQNMLSATDSPTIKASPAGDPNKYIEVMSDYMRITPYKAATTGTPYADLIKNYNGEDVTKGAPVWESIPLYVMIKKDDYYGITKDGVLYFAYALGNAFNNSDLQPNKAVFGLVLIDINGKTSPNRLGKDVFAFRMMQDGILKPVGASGWVSSDSPIDGGKFEWQNGTKDKCNEKEVTTGWSCAGSIYENNLKVIYQ